MTDKETGKRFAPQAVHLTPTALVPRYALQGGAPRLIAEALAAKLAGISVTMSAADAAAHIAEQLYIAGLEALLRQEDTGFPRSRECGLPFSDIALDALSFTAADILLPEAGQGVPSPAEVQAALINRYYRHYIERLLLFNLTQAADPVIMDNPALYSFKERDLHLFNITYPCRYDVEELTEEGLSSADSARRIGAMPFVGKARLPRLIPRVICCGAENRSHPARADRYTRFLSVDEPGRNLLCRRRKIERAIGKRLSPISRDLLEVAAYIYAGDVVVHRTQRWRRSIRFVIPVRHPGRWHKIKRELALAASFVSGDHIAFEFTQRQESAAVERLSLTKMKKSPAVDCVSLLSGGLDSFAGCLQLVEEGRRPLMVGHFKQGPVAARQREVVKILEQHSPQPLPLLRLDIGLAPGRQRLGFGGKLEYSQRMRSLLFLSLAAVAAAELDLEEIFIPENGILAFNLPLAACRTGSRSTRSAHPRFLHYFERIIGSLYGRPLKVRNPLVFKSKAQTLDIFKKSGTAGLARSISCSRFSYGVMMDPRRNGRDCSHCGACLACLVRRAAVLGAGLEAHDADYILAPFTADGTAGLRSHERLGLFHLIHFCREIEESDNSQLLRSFPQLLLPDDYFPDLQPGHSAALEAAAMFRRFADEVLTICRGADAPIKEWCR
jgi:7-cyano-7-deazaguanine synthase in queuosine biosynthesis